MVVAEGDVVVLKLIQPPPMSEFDDLVLDASTKAREAGMKRSDIAAAIKGARAVR